MYSNSIEEAVPLGHTALWVRCPRSVFHQTFSTNFMCTWFEFGGISQTAPYGLAALLLVSLCFLPALISCGALPVFFSLCRFPETNCAKLMKLQTWRTRNYLFCFRYHVDCDPLCCIRADSHRGCCRCCSRLPHQVRLLLSLSLRESLYLKKWFPHKITFPFPVLQNNIQHAFLVISLASDQSNDPLFPVWKEINFVSRFISASKRQNISADRFLGGCCTTTKSLFGGWFQRIDWLRPWFHQMNFRYLSSDLMWICFQKEEKRKSTQGRTCCKTREAKNEDPEHG